MCIPKSLHPKHDLYPYSLLGQRSHVRNRQTDTPRYGIIGYICRIYILHVVHKMRLADEKVIEVDFLHTMNNLTNKYTTHSSQTSADRSACQADISEAS